jgi:hypothetical protein
MLPRHRVDPGGTVDQEVMALLVLLIMEEAEEAEEEPVDKEQLVVASISKPPQHFLEIM